ncbi:MAG: PD40 domain-containing protein [Flavobacteriales bacterium]|nr:PD40 domain-containing protein [Flavobacteriales bacterium]
MKKIFYSSFAANYDKYLLSILLICTFSINVCNAQDDKELKAMTREANMLFEEMDYSTAFYFYTKLDSLEPGNSTCQYRIGVYYAVSYNEKTEAIPYLEYALKNMDPQEFPFEGDYYLGMAYHFDLQFEKAIVHLKKYLAIIERDVYESSKVKRLIENCENGRELIKKPIDVAIRNLGPEVNSKYTDHSPFISADEGTLIFTSRREGSKGGILNDDGQYMEDIYMSKKVNDSWAKPVNLDNVNSKEMDACVGVSVDGQKLFIYIAGKGGSDIYMSEQDGENWSAPVKLNNKINTSKYNENSASLSADGNMLYFSSDRPGGYGGFDIYASKMLPTGDWDVAKNLGPKVNSKYNEDSPFIHPDNKTLYYSSNGFNSIGGNDIFFAKLESDRWTSPTNIGHPINTPGNDNTIVISANNKHAYFTAERKGGYGGNDIYVATLPETGSDALTLVKGIITDSESGKPIKASIKVYDKETKHRINYVYSPNPETGTYMMIFSPGKNYDMVIEAEGYSNYLVNIYIPDQKHFYELTQVIELSKIAPSSDAEAGEIITVKSTIIDYIGEEPENTNSGDGFEAKMKTESEYDDLVNMLELIIFNTDSMALSNLDDEVEKIGNEEGKVEEEPNYDFLLGMLETVIETTDSMALENLDKVLETEVSVKKYLYKNRDTTSEGVNYGGTTVQILGKVDVNEGEKIKAEQRENKAAERRADERKAERDRIKALFMDEAGIHDETIEAVAVQEPVKEEVVEEPVKEPEPDPEPEPVVKVVEFEKLYAIQFVHNSFDLTPNSKKTLAKLLDILTQDNSIKVELHGHADNVGEDDFNMKLSEKRSMAILKYFDQRKIDSVRIKVFNLGEKKPATSNDTEAGRQKNRRVEVKLSR